MLGVNKLLAFLRRSVGLRDDAASATGSLHAKVADLATTKHNALTASINTRQKPRGPAGAFGTFSTAEVTYQTALNITGIGTLRALKARKASAGPEGQTAVKITIDGHVVADGRTPSVTATTDFFPVEFMFVTDGTTTTGWATLANGGRPIVNLDFKTSLKIEVMRLTGGDGASVMWYYEIE